MLLWIAAAVIGILISGILLYKYIQDIKI